MRRSGAFRSCGEALAVLDRLERIGHPPGEPRRHAELRQFGGDGEGVVHVERVHLPDQRLGAAVRGIVRPVQFQRFGATLRIVMAADHQRVHDLLAERVGQVAQQRSGGAHRLHARNRPGVVADGVAEEQAAAEARPAHRGDLHHAAAEVVAGEHGTVDAEGPGPGEQVGGLARDRDVAVDSGRYRRAVADHLERQAARALDARQHMAPERRAGRYAVDEDQRRSGALFVPDHRDAVDDRGASFHAGLLLGVGEGR